MRSKESVDAQVESITPLTDSILRIILNPEHYIDYKAGQYLEILSGKEAFSYSIANAPLGSHKYELHVRHSQENPYNQQLLTEIKQRGSVTIRLPLGDCYLDQLQANRPILFIAAGTGFAPIKAMIEQLLVIGDMPAFELFWGARSQSDLYMNELVAHWQSHVAQFRYFSLLSNVSKDSLPSLVLEQHPLDVKQWQFVIAGPFDMVYTTRDVLVARGVLLQQLFSDAFSFERRKG